MALQETRVFQAMGDFRPFGSPPISRPNPPLESWHIQMARKYRDALENPLAPIEPDPPEPK